MLTDTDLAELERLCKAREGQRFAGLVLELLAAYRAERARAANAWADANMDRQALVAAREEAEGLQKELNIYHDALELIANRDPVEMGTARTLHYDMRGWAMAALGRAASARRGEG